MKIKNKEFEPSQEHEGCYVYGDGSEDSETAESEALALQSEALRKGYYCVCGVVNGEGYGLYLVPKNGIQSVIELFEVGTHGGGDPCEVWEEIEMADDLNPLIPYFADISGLKAKFSKPVNDELLDVLDEHLTSIEAMIDEEEGTIDAFVREHKGIHLWWD